MVSRSRTFNKGIEVHRKGRTNQRNECERERWEEDSYRINGVINMHDLIVFKRAKDVEDAINSGDMRQECVAETSTL